MTIRNQILISPLNSFKFFTVFPEAFIPKSSLAHVLFLYKYSQPLRHVYFTLCCILPLLKDISLRYFFLAWQRYGFDKFGFLFFFNYQASLFFFFETLMLGVDAAQFNHNYFYKSPRDPKFLLGYKSFHLRVDFLMFGLAWKALVGLRSRYYNIYMRYHFYINRWAFIETRRGLNERFYKIHANVRRHVAAHFLAGLREFKYKVYMLETIESRRPYASDFQNLLPTSGFFESLAPKYGFLRVISFFSPLLFLRFRYFKRGLHSWLGWIAGSILTRYGHYFRVEARWDLDHGPMIFHLIAMFPYTLSKFLALWLGEWEQELFYDFFNLSPFFYFNFFLDFYASRLNSPRHDIYLSPGALPRKYFSKYRAFSLQVNDGFPDIGFFSFFLHARARFCAHWIFADYWSMFRRFWYMYFQNFNFFGHFHSVSNLYLATGVSGIEYFQWRVYNNSSLYDFLGGRLQLPLLYEKVELDYIIYYRQRLLWTVYRRAMRLKAYGLYGHERPSLVRKKLRQRHFLIAPTPRFEIIDRALKDWSYNSRGKPQRPKLSLRLSLFVFLSLFAGLAADFWGESLKFSFIVFFAFDHQVVSFYHRKWALYQAQCTRALTLSQIATQRWIAIRKNFWGNYRRYLMRNGIHSLNDTSFRALWMRYFHKMRRTGFVKRDLPYYCYDESKDFLIDLSEQITSGSTTIFHIPAFKLVNENLI